MPCAGCRLGVNILSSAANNCIIRQIGLFSFAGVINTAMGYTVIFSGLALGFSPYYSNLAGYVFGLACAFTFSKTVIFTARGENKRQAGRFLVSFFLAYSVNLAGLHTALLAGVGALPAQIMAGIPYLIIMFFLSRMWVFKQ